MLAQILEFLVDTISGFFVFLLLARFHFQWLRVSFRSQLGNFIIALTNWIVLPARRVIPALGGLDLASLIAAWLLQTATFAVIFFLRGHDLGAAPGAVIATLFGLALVDLIRFSIFLLMFALILQMILSWTNPYTPIGSTFDAMVRPFLRPIRKFVPPISNIDLSPLVLIVLLQVLLIPIAYGRAMVAAML